MTPEKDGSAHRGTWMLRLEFKPRDAWIGAYWKRDRFDGVTVFDLWVCLLPMLPLHFQRWGGSVAHG